MENGHAQNTHDGPAPFDVAVVGAGLVGLPIALGLMRRNIPVTVYEQASELKEIGAGVAISNTGMTCLDFLDPRLAGAVENVADPSPAAYRCVDGFTQEDVRLRPADKLFDMVMELPGVVSYFCHRAQLLSAMVKLVPSHKLKLGKRVDAITPRDDGEKMVIRFSDGTTVEADAVIGCDGIKSRVRLVVAGEGNPAAIPHYAHESAYRCLVDMERAVPVLGELAKRQILFSGRGAHIMAYPVADSKYLNVAAFVRDNGSWPDEHRQTVSASKDEILGSFSGFGPYVRDLVGLLPEELSRWGMFDTLDHPLSSFSRGCITLAGDAAHGSTPHHGYGAGMGIEDAAVLAAVVEQAAAALKEGDGNVGKAEALAVAFEAYDSVRRERAQWLVRSSRRQGELVKWLVPEIGKVWGKMEKDTAGRLEQLLYLDVEGMIRQAKDEFSRRLELVG